MAGYVKHIIDRNPGETEEEYEERKRRINLSRTSNYLPIRNRLHHGGSGIQKIHNKYPCDKKFSCSAKMTCYTIQKP